MSFRLKFVGAIFLPCLLVIGCGGDGGSRFDSDDQTSSSGSSGSSASSGSSGGSTSTDPTNVSYVPLLVFEAFDDFSGLGSDGLFLRDGSYPFIEIFVINPINATTLDSIDDAVVANYEVTVDDIEISEDENFPVLQKVLGSPTYLGTALVFDVSGSVNGVDIDALVAEAKAYVTAAKASTNGTVSSQVYTVWAFGSTIEELTTGFTGNTATIEAALDQVAIRFNTTALGTTTNLHRAIVQSIGRYKADATASAPAYDFSADGTNDLIDVTTRNYVALSQLVLFSSGNPTALEMDYTLMTRAIQSQSFISYDDASSEADGSVSRYKPVFYYVVGGTSVGETYTALRDLSEVTTQLVLSSGAYSFSAGLVQNQIDAIEKRVDVDNLYIYSYAFAPRIGDHTRIFTSKSDNFNYSLTGSYPADGFVGDGSPGTPAEVLASLVEITGPNGEYLASQTASLSEVATFAPATRWVNTPYGNGDYLWTRTGGTGTANADGTYTVTSVTVPTTLQLTNTVLGHTTTITVTN
jgi:hypothetical protein